MGYENMEGSPEMKQLQLADATIPRRRPKERRPLSSIFGHVPSSSSSPFSQGNGQKKENGVVANGIYFGPSPSAPCSPEPSRKPHAVFSYGRKTKIPGILSALMGSLNLSHSVDLSHMQSNGVDEPDFDALLLSQSLNLKHPRPVSRHPLSASLSPRTSPKHNRRNQEPTLQESAMEDLEDSMEGKESNDVFSSSEEEKRSQELSTEKDSDRKLVTEKATEEKKKENEEKLVERLPQNSKREKEGKKEGNGSEENVENSVQRVERNNKSEDDCRGDGKPSANVEAKNVQSKLKEENVTALAGSSKRPQITCAYVSDSEAAVDKSTGQTSLNVHSDSSWYSADEDLNILEISAIRANDAGAVDKDKSKASSAVAASASTPKGNSFTNKERLRQHVGTKMKSRSADDLLSIEHELDVAQEEFPVITRPLTHHLRPPRRSSTSSPEYNTAESQPPSSNCSSEDLSMSIEAHDRKLQNKLAAAQVHGDPLAARGLKQADNERVQSPGSGRHPRLEQLSSAPLTRWRSFDDLLESLPLKKLKLVENWSFSCMHCTNSRLE